MATDGKRKGKLNIPQLKDANLAGTANSGDCTLILTVGYSAKSFAMSGLSVVGQDKYGVFPLKGNLLNVRKASPQRVQRNAKIQEIKNILGLQDGKTYENVKELRYGHLLIMATDQDHDGSNMIGLLINFLHYFWPSLLKVKNNFMQMCRTPIVKASDKKTNEVLSFYTMPEYEAWKEKLGNKATQYKIKYHKQLETFEREEVKEYFADLDHHIENFGLVDDKDGDVIELAYGLLINFLHYFWPSLLKVKNNFMQMCRTPIVKASDKKTNEVLSFYTMPEYEAWKEKLGNKATQYKIKYHKQLETFEREEVKEYFADLDHHIENFGLVDDKDGDVIELAYGKNIEARKEWLQAPDQEKYPLTEKRAPAKRARDVAGPQRANKKSSIWVSDSDATEDSDFEDEE
ncbi:Arginine repressor C-terminal-like domain-containing protein [Artemisia annua]|uniref:DNA topoisomerase (ATP-hydrolyzing) n=1 Tax=Artemisia annua TaxID=35608 RepID=A0A2U1K8S8_ARTAN|nr:Arginine repressor C-terminal-like domain-containing protein [Artemisia annua]